MSGEDKFRAVDSRQRLECAELAPAFGRVGAFESAGKPGALQTLARNSVPGKLLAPAGGLVALGKGMALGRFFSYKGTRW